MNAGLVIDGDIYDGVACNDETHIYGCPCRAGGDAVIAKAFCRCRRNRYETQEEASKHERSGADKCSHCHTFARDHGYYGGDADNEWRCMECDVHEWSHGGPSLFPASPVIPVAAVLDEDAEDPSHCSKCGAALEEPYIKGFYASCGDCFGGASEPF